MTAPIVDRTPDGGLVGTLPDGAQRRETRFCSGEEELVGDLVLPAGDGPFPALLTVAGTGPQNRYGGLVTADGTVEHHGRHRWVGNRLAAAGIAQLCWDKRGVQASTGGDREPFDPPGDRDAHASVETDVADLLAALEHLAAQPEVDAERGAITEGMRAVGLPTGRNKVFGNSIACTSHRFCNYSVAETKGKLQELLEAYDARYGDAIEDLKIFMDGCPHACAHHWVGDIGLQGTTTKLPDGQRVEAYDVTLRGGLGPDAAVGTPLLRRVPTGDLEATLDRLIAPWVSERAARNGSGDAFTFRRFLDEWTDDELRALALGESPPEKDEDAGSSLPFVRVPGTLLQLSDGADDIPVEATTVREALAVLERAHPRLVAELLLEPGKVNPVYNLYVGEDDIRSLGGLDATLESGDELLILPALAGG